MTPIDIKTAKVLPSFSTCLHAKCRRRTSSRFGGDRGQRKTD